MDWLIPILVVSVILILAGVCFLKLPRIDEGNSDIYGKDYFCTDDDRREK